MRVLTIVSILFAVAQVAFSLPINSRPHQDGDDAVIPAQNDLVQRYHDEPQSFNRELFLGDFWQRDLEARTSTQTPKEKKIKKERKPSPPKPSPHPPNSILNASPRGRKEEHRKARVVGGILLPTGHRLYSPIGQPLPLPSSPIGGPSSPLGGASSSLGVPSSSIPSSSGSSSQIQSLSSQLSGPRRSQRLSSQSLSSQSPSSQSPSSTGLLQPQRASRPLSLASGRSRPSIGPPSPNSSKPPTPPPKDFSPPPVPPKNP
ncbi:hypothetical protein K439DRAFT_1663643 [Ramaria rubella]|nr:hypothetical protein K439DRAFT_1663643 [Ramaria rubella]